MRGYTFKFTPKRDLIVPDAAIPKTEDFKADWDTFVEMLPPKVPPAPSPVPAAAR